MDNREWETALWPADAEDVQAAQEEAWLPPDRAMPEHCSPYWEDEHFNILRTEMLALYVRDVGLIHGAVQDDLSSL